MPCNSIATANATLADLTVTQFAQMMREFKAKNIEVTETQVTASHRGCFIEYANGRVEVSGGFWDREVVIDEIKRGAIDMRAVLIYQALDDIARVTASQRVPGGYVLEVEI